jgi:hypothetical protein
MSEKDGSDRCARYTVEVKLEAVGRVKGGPSSFRMETHSQTR